VEAAVTLAEETSGKACALSIGDAKIENSKLKKGILSRGLDELFLVKDDSLKNTDTHQTAKVLASAASKTEYDVIFCGEGSSDNYAQQTGVQLGVLLGIPVINAVSKVTAVDGKLLVERSLENTVEVLEVELPAVISVTSDINKTRLPSMKEILAAGKKPVTIWSLSDAGVDSLEQTVETLSVVAPKQKERKHMIFEGEDKVAELFENVSKELK
jgi:electron transfer flavoprotein beta subunit